MSHATYLQELLYPEKLNALADEIAEAILLRREDQNIQGIAVIGISSITMGAVVSAKTGIPLIILRKPEDTTHSDEKIEYPDDFYGNYVIVDDLIASGVTVNNIQFRLKYELGCSSELVGIYLYHTKVAKSRKITSYTTPMGDEVLLYYCQTY